MSKKAGEPCPPVTEMVSGLVGSSSVPLAAEETNSLGSLKLGSWLWKLGRLVVDTEWRYQKQLRKTGFDVQGRFQRQNWGRSVQQNRLGCYRWTELSSSKKGSAMLKRTVKMKVWRWRADWPCPPDHSQC